MKPVTHDNHISHLSIKGFKSIAECDLELGALNILIGANGAGKSNFLGLFKLVANILANRLQNFVAKSGGPDYLLHYGRKTTEQLNVDIQCGDIGYGFELQATDDNRMMFSHEALRTVRGDWRPQNGHLETSVHQPASRQSASYDYIIPSLQAWRVYHFHDTSSGAKVKRLHAVDDNDYLQEDGGNLASFLLRLRAEFPQHYQRIVNQIQLASPFFGDFVLEPDQANPELTQLQWLEKHRDLTFNASELSDGTLRFMLLTTLLMQPEELMPEIIVIDEPELGLHPFAITLLAGMVNTVRHARQVIVSTQSVEFIDHFEVEDLIVVDRRQGLSTFRRLEQDALAQWLEDYSPGELWLKNLLGGRPQP